MYLPDVGGEVHVKGAYLTGAPVFAVKTATGFYAELGLPVSGGMTMVHDAMTGTLRPIERVTVWGRRQAAQQYRRDMAAAGVPVSIAATAREAVQGAEVVITVTSSTAPLVEAGWLGRGAHVTAVGSDMPHKQELNPRILVAAGKYVPDSIDAAAASGELHHALEAGLLEVGSVYGELTAVASGRLAGRTAGDELTVADLTGLRIQDAAVAALAARLAGEHGVGRDVPLGDW